MAKDADHLARRVYGKMVETDEDVRRIEATEQRAKVWAQLADDIEALTALVGEGAAWRERVHHKSTVATKPADANHTG